MIFKNFLNFIKNPIIIFPFVLKFFLKYGKSITYSLLKIDYVFN